MTTKDIIQSALDGYSGTVLAYGQTGSGKTFTISGTSSDYKYRGVIPRAIGALYHEIQNRYESQITVRVSYVEVYNEVIHDLLSTVGQDNENELNPNVAIQEDPVYGVFVKGAVNALSHTEEEALSLLFEGETNKTISEHKLNKMSSRSHCIFTINLETRSRVESSEKVIISKINVVDLAGSERTKKTGSEGLVILEASFINRSLSYLEQVVVALSERERDHVPYRQSKLTHLLKDSIGGNCKTIMIANVWPEFIH
jgi:kinesin family protein 6/9